MDVLNRLASWDGVEGQRKVKFIATLIAPPEMFDCADYFDRAEFDDSAGRCGIVSGGVSLFEARAPTLLSGASKNAPLDILSSTSRWQSLISASTAGMEKVFDRSTGLLRNSDFLGLLPLIAAKRRPVSNTTIAAQFLDLGIESWSAFDRLPTISLRRRCCPGPASPHKTLRLTGTIWYRAHVAFEKFRSTFPL